MFIYLFLLLEGIYWRLVAKISYNFKHIFVILRPEKNPSRMEN